MEIGKYEDRVKIEAKYRILKLYCEMKQQYNPHDSITDIGVREIEKKFIAGFIEALKLALKEIEELKWTNGFSYLTQLTIKT